jgi:Tol biopolymer transport system component
VSPDGTRVAIALGAAAQAPAVSVLDLGSMDRRTISGMTARAVAWMPGGRDLLVAAPAPDGVNHWIWRLPIGGGLPEPVLKGAEYWNDPRPSPDGTMIAAVRRTGTGSELVLHHLETGHERTLTAKAAVVAPRWSPDGRFLAWSGGWRPDEVGTGGVWVSPVEGGAPRRLTLDGAWPVWEKDGEHLLFARFLENEGIWRVALTGGSPRLVQRPEGDLEDLFLQGLDTGRNGAPMLFIFFRFTGELYVLEPPTS